MKALILDKLLKLERQLELQEQNSSNFFYVFSSGHIGIAFESFQYDSR